MAERKAAQGRASVYMYVFAWESPAFGGKYKSAHGFYLPFVFDNIDSAPGLWGSHTDPRGYELAEKMSRAWATFARAGNPNHAGLPCWKPYTLQERATMVFDYTCLAVNDPRREERLAIQKLRLVR
jgi:para-nitrobenzyl esterase